MRQLRRAPANAPGERSANTGRPASGTAPLTAAPLLDVTGLSVAFGGLHAVDELSMTLAKGEIVALIGPNGAGKTTTFNLLTGYLAPDRGIVSLEGEDITGMAPHRLAGLGMVRSFQTARLFPSMTVAEVVTTAAMLRSNQRAAARIAENVLEELELGPIAATRATQLSLPDRQMVELAKCLAMEPRLVLLDEIMGGMNRNQCAAPIAAIRRMRDRGIAVLMIEHVMPIVMNLVDRIVVLDFGRVLAEGTPSEIAAHPEVQRSYLGGTV